MDKDKYRADVASQSIILEVNSHVLDALSVPFELAELHNIRVVHLGWENDRLSIPKAIEYAYKEEQDADAVRHERKADTRVSCDDMLEILDGHTSDTAEHHKHYYISEVDHHDASLETEYTTATLAFVHRGQVLADLQRRP